MFLSGTVDLRSLGSRRVFPRRWKSRRDGAVWHPSSVASGKVNNMDVPWALAWQGRG